MSMIIPFNGEEIVLGALLGINENDNFDLESWYNDLKPILIYNAREGNGRGVIYLSKEIRIHLNDIIDKYDISLNKLARESNIEPARLWELANY
ncbi:hypothetical protein HCB27_07575 [Listeria booriae]|uniref:Uncharacterized protein n=1 Tax=Listeria booriae TaxID=1552123 RepID=A0A7X1D8B4_9LIST|nr:hypothetical protein [Listeria booriae]MBC2176470.1 hypothetical protein [Listeria booriae]MDT0111077.1 hypothetical protein [Listeria booriae]